MAEIMDWVEALPLVRLINEQGLMRWVGLVAATLGVWLLVGLVRRTTARISRWVVETPRVGAIRVKGQEVVDADEVANLVGWVVRACGWVVIGLFFYVYLAVALDVFRATDALAERLFGALFDAAWGVVLAIVRYIPDLAALLVVVGMGFGAVSLAKNVFKGLETKRIRIHGFYADWARPTFNIVRILIFALTAVVAFPYLPASGSPAFQGVSIFLGVLFSLGSTGAVTNAVSGVLLTYMRVFQLGDRVLIADAAGIVVQRTMFVTRLRTPKNVEISIPNSMVLNNHIINYSTLAERRGVALHTTVTIGYDVPWRQVRDLLLQAAAATEAVEDKPEPFVLQTALDDFYVHYELNIYTKTPEAMPSIYSDLHASIVDTFAEAGVEIASPHLRQQRDGNAANLPDEYLPKDYRPGGFRLFKDD